MQNRDFQLSEMDDASDDKWCCDLLAARTSTPSRIFLSLSFSLSFENLLLFFLYSFIFRLYSYPLFLISMSPKRRWKNEKRDRFSDLIFILFYPSCRTFLWCLFLNIQIRISFIIFISNNTHPDTCIYMTLDR